MTDTPAIPPVIWLDLTQVRMGYTSDPETVEPGDVAFVPLARMEVAEEALRLSLRTLRRLCEEYFCGCSLRMDPTSITPDDFDLAADDMDAIRAAEAVIGPVEDFHSVDTAFLNACLAEAARREADAERQVP